MTFSCLSGADSRCLLLSQCNAQNVRTLKLAKVIFFCYYLYFWKFLAPWLISLIFPHVSCRKFSELVAIVAKRSQLLSARSPCTVCAYTIVSLACIELEKGADRSQIVVCVGGAVWGVWFFVVTAQPWSAEQVRGWKPFPYLVLERKVNWTPQGEC